MLKALKKLFAAIAIGAPFAVILSPNPAFAQANWYTPAIIASGTYSATQTSADITNGGYKCGQIFVNVTAATGSPSFTPHIQGKDQLSGTYYDVLIGPAITATGVTVLKVCPGLQPSPNGATSDLLPYQWRVQMLWSGTGSETFAVSANLNQ